MVVRQRNDRIRILDDCQLLDSSCGEALNLSHQVRWACRLIRSSIALAGRGCCGIGIGIRIGRSILRLIGKLVQTVDSEGAVVKADEDAVTWT